MKGTLLWFNEVDDIGVIVDDDGAKLPVDGPNFVDGLRPKGRCKGTLVEFQVADVAGESTATEVNVLPESSPRRARRRRPSTYSGY